MQVRLFLHNNSPWFCSYIIHTSLGDVERNSLEGVEEILGKFISLVTSVMGPTHRPVA